MSDNHMMDFVSPFAAGWEMQGQANRDAALAVIQKHQMNLDNANQQLNQQRFDQSVRQEGTGVDQWNQDYGQRQQQMEFNQAQAKAEGERQQAELDYKNKYLVQQITDAQNRAAAEQQTAAQKIVDEEYTAQRAMHVPPETAMKNAWGKYNSMLSLGLVGSVGGPGVQATVHSPAFATPVREQLPSDYLQMYPPPVSGSPTGAAQAPSHWAQALTSNGQERTPQFVNGRNGLPSSSPTAQAATGAPPRISLPSVGSVPPPLPPAPVGAGGNELGNPFLPLNELGNPFLPLTGGVIAPLVGGSLPIGIPSPAAGTGQDAGFGLPTQLSGYEQAIVNEAHNRSAAQASEAAIKGSEARIKKGEADTWQQTFANNLQKQKLEIRKAAADIGLSEFNLRRQKLLLPSEIEEAGLRVGLTRAQLAQTQTAANLAQFNFNKIKQWGSVANWARNERGDQGPINMQQYAHNQYINGNQAAQNVQKDIAGAQNQIKTANDQLTTYNSLLSKAKADGKGPGDLIPYGSQQVQVSMIQGLADNTTAAITQMSSHIQRQQDWGKILTDNANAFKAQSDALTDSFKRFGIKGPVTSGGYPSTYGKQGVNMGGAVKPFQVGPNNVRPLPTSGANRQSLTDQYINRKPTKPAGKPLSPKAQSFMP